MAIRRERRRKKVAGLNEDKSGFQPLDVSFGSVTPADGRGWDDAAPLALEVVLSEDKKIGSLRKPTVSSLPAIWLSVMFSANWNVERIG